MPCPLRVEEVRSDEVGIPVRDLSLRRHGAFATLDDRTDLLAVEPSVEFSQIGSVALDALLFEDPLALRLGSGGLRCRARPVRFQLEDRRKVFRDDVNEALIRYRRRSTPVGSAVVARHLNGWTQARRREKAFVARTQYRVSDLGSFFGAEERIQVLIR